MKHWQTELEGRKKQLEAVGGTPSWASLIAEENVTWHFPLAVKLHKISWTNLTASKRVPIVPLPFVSSSFCSLPCHLALIHAGFTPQADSAGQDKKKKLTEKKDNFFGWCFELVQQRVQHAVEPAQGMQWDYIPGGGEGRAGEGRGDVTLPRWATMVQLYCATSSSVTTGLLSPQFFAECSWLCYGSFGTSQQLIFFVISR